MAAPKGPKKSRPRRARRPRPQRPPPRRPADAVIATMLRQLHRERVPISAKGKGAMISYVCCVCDEVAAAARCHRSRRRRCVIGLRELRDALRRILPRPGAPVPS